MRLIVGLGNPGPEYAGHRHNIGFMAVEEIARRHRLGAPRSRFHGLVRQGEVAGVKVVLLQPQTYMNDSGRAVAAAARFYKLAPEAIVVIHDEIDLVPGKVRVKRGGGSAGHNGLRSIDDHIGPDFWRVRLGVGHPGRSDLVEGYVLHAFAKEERQPVAKLVEAVADALPLLLAGEEGRFLSRVTHLVHPPKPKPPRAPGAGD